MSVSSEVLVESRTMRSQYTAKADALDHVGSLILLPDDAHATTEMVARYYGVDVEAIKSAVRRHHEELTSSGMASVTSKDFERVGLTLSSEHGGQRRVRLFSRKAILNVGMLLRDSEVAQQIRAYLLNAEEALTEEQRKAAWVRTRLVGVESRKSFTEVLQAVYEVSETTKSFGIWASLFTKMMTKTTLGITEAEFKQLKLAGGGNAREAMTTEQLTRMDQAEGLVRYYAAHKGADSIKSLYHEAKELMG